jgi:hypothetical protein
MTDDAIPIAKGINAAGTNEQSFGSRLSVMRVSAQTERDRRGIESCCVETPVMMFRIRESDPGRIQLGQIPRLKRKDAQNKRSESAAPKPSEH